MVMFHFDFNGKYRTARRLIANLLRSRKIIDSNILETKRRGMERAMVTFP